MKGRLKRASGLFGVATALLLVFIPAAGSGGVGNGLFAFVRVTNAGPLPACAPDQNPCTGANRVDHFVYVANLNPLSDVTGRGLSRATLRDAFVVDNVQQRIFINGVESGFGFTFTPPPDPSYRPWAGHWPATATCPAGGDPCDVVSNPAVVPGENASVLFAGWLHGVDEPDGTYVFKYTIRGTLNGAPVELYASGPPILMTR